MNKFLLFAVAGLIWFGVAAMPVQAEGMTKEQGDAILKELQSIRALLQKGQNQAKKQRAPGRVKVSSTDGVSYGNPEAPLILIEFTDYECPYCKRFYDTTFAEIKKKYIDTGKLRFISRNLPLPFHKHAKNAALAAACAGDQGKYWQMRKSIFGNPKQMQAEHLSAYAKDNGLNVKRFDTCMTNKTHTAKIKKDMADARAIGVTGTPSFVLAKSGGDVVEGEKLIGAQRFATFDAKIQALLKQGK
jgi:protein-disulfide isomerase